MLRSMDSLPQITEPPSTWSPRLPSWVQPRGQDLAESDAAFAADIALKSLDDLIRADPPWLGCRRDRLALKSATAARMLGRNEEENALPDAVMLTSAGDDPGLAGKLFLATRLLVRRSATSPHRSSRSLLSCRGLVGTTALQRFPI